MKLVGWRELGFLALMLALGAYVAAALKVETSVAKLLPPAEQELSQLAQQVIDSTLTRTMVLSVGPRAATPEAREGTKPQLAVARELGRRLGKHPEVSWVRMGPDAKLERAIYDLYFPRRFNFVAKTPAELARALATEGMQTRAEALRRELSGAQGPLIRTLAERDPLLLFSRHLERLQGVGPAELGVSGGQFLAKDGHAILFIGLRHSALDGTRQAELLAAIDREFADARRTTPELVLERSGVNVFAVDSETRIKEDTSRVSLYSTLGILILFVVLFRSIRSVVAAFVPLLAGVVVALAATQWLFGEVHALTLAFGASLLGAGIDYPVHLMTQAGLDADSSDVPQGLMSGLVLGALTTVVGFGALGFAGFSVMQQVAVFSGVGLCATLLVTLWILPRHIGTGHVEPRRTLAFYLVRAVAYVGRRRWQLFLLSLVLFVVGIYGLERAAWAPNLEGLAPLDPELRAEDARVRARIGAPGSNEVVLAIGATPELALQANQRAYQKLEAAAALGLVENFRSLSDLLWSEREQRQSFEALGEPRVKAEFQRAFEREGFNVDAFQAFFEEQKHGFAPLTLSALEGSTLAPWLQGFVLQRPGQTVILSYPKLKREGAELSDWLKGTEGVYFIDQRQLLDSAYTALRARIAWLMVAGGVLIAGIVLWRYRRPLLTLRTLVPALVAPLAAPGILGLCGVTLNLFHLFAALVVLSMAVDYGIFLSEMQEADGAAVPGTQGTPLSIALSASTTCLSFGLLGFSSVPVLAAIGQTVALGIGLAVLTAPVVPVLVGGWLRGHSHALENQRGVDTAERKVVAHDDVG